MIRYFIVLGKKMKKSNKFLFKHFFHGEMEQISNVFAFFFSLRVCYVYELYDSNVFTAILEAI